MHGAFGQARECGGRVWGCLSLSTEAGVRRVRAAQRLRVQVVQDALRSTVEEKSLAMRAASRPAGAGDKATLRHVMTKCACKGKAAMLGHLKSAVVPA